MRRQDVFDLEGAAGATGATALYAALGCSVTTCVHSTEDWPVGCLGFGSSELDDLDNLAVKILA